MKIQPLAAAQIPRDLLLLADPSWAQVTAYLSTGQCYGYQQRWTSGGCCCVDNAQNRGVGS
ncbi:GNAT family acetyltransferase [Lactiplantibacillus plantarum]|nr:GNAT family acetyltransferase [Lactiplantibacillus plantarum]